ncbi:HAD-IA family hydrolase [Albidovulum sp.]
MSRPLRLVVFDVDGTLIDSQDHILAAMAEAFAAEGEPVPPRPRILSVVGLSLPVAVARLAPHLPPDRQARIEAAYRAGFARLRAAPARETAPLFPGARAALEALGGCEGVLLGIATGKSRRGLDHVLAEHGMTGLFDTVQVADDHPSKPHPSMLHAALAETGVRAADAVMVGDTTFDIEMARAAGLRGIAVGWGYHPAPALLAAGAARVIDDFGSLAGILATLWEAA